MTALANLHTPFGRTPWGIRRVEVPEPSLLRLFFLSLLWRAAMSEMREFAEVELPPEHIEQLRRMVAEGDPDPISFYPGTLTQLSTMGTVHNMTPLAQNKHIPAVGEHPSQTIPIFRFYFDGLIVHMHRQGSDNGDTKVLGNLIVGAKRELVVSTVTYERSFERENLSYVKAETVYR
jgi:hypothetical protein